jgi:hypothetical protein
MLRVSLKRFSIVNRLKVYVRTVNVCSSGFHDYFTSIRKFFLYSGKLSYRKSVDCKVIMLYILLLYK